MVTRRRRSRRRKSWSSRLRRFLIAHRFNAAQASLGIVALTAALWLLWPPAQTDVVDHRGLWEHSLQIAGHNFDGREEAIRDGLMAVTRSSLAMSAKGQVPGSAGAQETESVGSRLARIAEVMPAIGVPDSAAIGPDLALAVDLPAGEATSADLAIELLARDVPAMAEASAAARAVRGANANPTLAQLLPRRLPEPRAELGRGTPTWLRNAVAMPLSDGRPMIAVVIDDLGLNLRGTAALNQLKGPLTLSFLPYASALESQTMAARAAGHELMVHVPMEPGGSDWPGPNALLDSLSPAELTTRLRANLRSFRGFVGINNHMGSLLTADRAQMAVVMAELQARGLLFLDSRTTAQSVAAGEARQAGVPHAVRDVFLDNDTDLASIRRQLVTTERIARRRGVAVAIGHPHDATIEALRGWLPTLEERGFVLAPISAVAARESCANGLLAASIACGHYLSAHNTVVVE